MRRPRENATRIAATGQRLPAPPVLFTLPVRVYYQDTDSGGVVFHANYLAFFERARTEWLRSRGIGQQALREATGGIFVVSEAQLKYHRPARLDDELLVTARLQESGRASLTIAQQAWRKTAGQPELLCEGSIRIGWVCAASMKPERIPRTLLEALT